MTDSRLSIKQIAQQTRRWAMRNRSKNFHNVQEEDYDYFDFGSDLCGMCAIAAAELFRRLQSAGYKPKIAVRNKKVEGHCFIIVDEKVVDVTATQFGMKPVEIVARNQKRLPSFWRHTSLFDSVEDLILCQKRTGWPIEQTAFSR